MAPATRLTCGMPGCTLGQGAEEGLPYKTPEHLTTIDQTSQDMDRHIEIHKMMSTQQRPTPNASMNRAPKAERPQLGVGITEQEWTRWTRSWGLHKTITKVTGQEANYELLHCLSKELYDAAGDEGYVNLELTENEILKGVKKLAVKGCNCMVTTLQFQRTGQDRGEPVATYAARLRGIAANCGFEILCSGCNTKVSYAEKSITQQLVHGLADGDIQQQVLSKAAAKEEDMTLTQVVAAVEALEMGKRDKQFLGTSGGGLLRQGQPGGNEPKTGPCQNCGWKGHSAGSEDCRAKDKECSYCKVKGHLAKCCRKAKKEKPKVTKGKAKTTSAETEDQDAEDGTTGTVTRVASPGLPPGGGSFFFMMGEQPPTIASGGWGTPQPQSSAGPPHSPSTREETVPSTGADQRGRKGPTMQQDLKGKSHPHSDSHYSLATFMYIFRLLCPLLGIWYPSLANWTWVLGVIIACYKNMRMKETTWEMTRTRRSRCKAWRRAMRIRQVTTIGSVCHLAKSPVQAQPHYTFQKEDGVWKQCNPRPHPKMRVKIRVDTDSYKSRGLPAPRRPKEQSLMAICDSGAQMCVMGPKEAACFGIQREEYTPAAMTILVADNRTKKAMGMTILHITGENKDTGYSYTTRQQVYILDGCKGFFLSDEAMEQLGVYRDFPSVGAAMAQGKASDDYKSAVSGAGEIPSSRAVKSDRECKCSDREMPPEVPQELPYLPTKDNIPLLRRWIVEKYKASAFNICSNQKLPLVQGSPPLRLYLDKSIKGAVCHKCASIPLHLQQGVKDGLDRDVRMGVLRKVPPDEPVGRYLHRMVVAVKKNGKPRRTVDLKALNRACPRQTHSVEPPFLQASAVPEKTWRTCLDAKDGYHSIPIHPDDWKHTQFLTPWGRYEYMTTPQGHLAAGDGYCHRYDEITREFKDYKRCVDDTILWAGDIESNFRRTCEYLTLCSKHGIIFNEEKFQFCQREVEFVGYQLHENGMTPTPTMLQSIKEFPRPADISGVRGWFGLVEQVAWAFSKTEVMAPFRHLLKSKEPFVWTQELQESFEGAKEEIARKVINGIRSFQMGRTTALVTDWSKVGIAFVLMQKYCGCRDVHPRCCEDGWQLCLTGSRFNTDAEQRYAPVEGEALGVAWALDKARHFTAGCHDLWVGVDHKPLLGIYRPDRALADIDNPRLRRLAERACRFKFTAVHVRGKDNNIADEMSRHPVSTITVSGGWGTPQPQSSGALGALAWASAKGGQAAGWMALAGWRRAAVTASDIVECNQMEAEILMETREALTKLEGADENFGVINAIRPRVLTWGRLQDETAKDSLCQSIVEALHAGPLRWPDDLGPLKRHKDDLSIVDGVILYKGRSFIPQDLREEVMATLHSGHQGTTSMGARASHSIWWPGLETDIHKVREFCRECGTNTPSQRKEPPVPLPHLEYPFQQICSDYFTLVGRQYLVIVDRYSGWPSVHRAQREDAKEMVGFLKDHCETFGVPEVLTTDGGTQYMAEETKRFLEDWGITHRVSSAYNPHGNTRAELAVKSMKRLIRDNLGPSGSLDTVAFGRALLMYRNTPDRDTGKSPAQVIFGRQLRDFIPVVKKKYEPREEWLLTREQREQALMKRHLIKGEELSRGTRQMTPLEVGNVVQIQNQTGPHKLKWDKSGVVVECLGNSQYKVKVDGSGRITLRNRIYLKRVVTYPTVEAKERSGTLEIQRSDYKGPKETSPLVTVTPSGPTIPHTNMAETPTAVSGDWGVPQSQSSVPSSPEDVRRSTRNRRAPDWFAAGRLTADVDSRPE